MKQKHKTDYQQTTWVGECVCGQMVYEVEDGTRYVMGGRRKHTPEECQHQAKLHRKQEQEQAGA
jgi:hypothetical protein